MEGGKPEATEQGDAKEKLGNESQMSTNGDDLCFNKHLGKIYIHMYIYVYIYFLNIVDVGIS